MTTTWKDILEIPPAVQHSQALLDGFDRCFLVGFGRLGEEHLDTLHSLSRVFGPTPLGEAFAHSLEAIERSEFSETHFQRLAAARAALQGAQHDALLAQLSQDLGRPLHPSSLPQAEAPQAPTGLTEGTRQWLTELALAGFPQLTRQSLDPYLNTLEQLQQDPSSARLALLLTGFLEEISAALPIASPQLVPLRRWVDLWTRAMLLAIRTPSTQTATPVQGSFFPMGVDIHHHPFAVSYTVHGLLQEKDASPRWIKTTHTSYKVDLLQDAETWQLFETDPFLEALNAGKSAEIKQGQILDSGELLPHPDVQLGKPYDALALAKTHLALEAEKPVASLSPSPIDRHPVQLAFPVWLEGVTRKEDDASSLQLDGTPLRLAEERISLLSGLEQTDLQKVPSMIGLLRYDQDGYAFQPLALAKDAKKGKLIFAGQEASKQAAAKKSKVLEILKERSTRLLRK